jgi:nitrite reductase/ring-hydroxylating ferredoxin subunit
MPLAVAHASMFQTAGSYRVVEHAAGFPLILVLGKDHLLRCFHNVCRHRAYPVISSNKVGCRPNLGCKYHGWTYNLRGDLIKAPKFEDAEGFRKDQNSLFEVKTEIDDDGIVNVDLSSKPDQNAVLDTNKFSKGRMENWEVKGAFNWKMAGMQDTSLYVHCRSG